MGRQIVIIGLFFVGVIFTGGCIRSDGPRFGVVHATGDVALGMKAAGNTPTRAAFGWQFEHQFLSTEGGTEGLVEFVDRAKANLSR